MKLLIADDDRMSRHLLQRTLQEWGHDVVAVRDGLEAWEALRQDDGPQMAILDWVMPGLDGLEVCRRAREIQIKQSVYIILLTAKADKHDLVEGLSAGANDYLTKPFDRAELKARVQAGCRMVEMQMAMLAELAERKRAEEILRVSEQRFRSLIENSSDAIALFNLKGDILYASPSTPQVLGYTPEEFVNLNSLDILHPDDRDSVKDHITASLNQPHVGITAESRVRHKSGEWRWMEATITNLLREPGVGAFVNNYRDISERKETSQALRESEEQLRLLQRLEAVGRLAGGIAHDFNNLLTVINGYAGLLLQRIDDDRLRERVGEIKKAGERATALTQQLLAFSRKQVLQAKVLDLNAVITNIDEMLQRVIGENVELVFSLNANIGKVKADPCQLEQAIVNLVVNSRDAMPGGGKIVVATANSDLSGEFETQHKVVRRGDFVVLSVTDTGQGMDAETQKNIFEPFFTTKEVGKGTGLGLSTVYGIVKQSEGNIWVHSKPGCGTSVSIYLPRVNEAVRNQAELIDDQSVPKGNETILLVEDERIVRNIAREVLEMNGYKVLVAADGNEALSISSDPGTAIDLLLTDVVMPGMSGRALAERFAEMRPKAKVLYMSGYTEDAILRHGVGHDGPTFLEKPFAPNVLALKVREVLHPGAPRAKSKTS